MVSNIEIGHKYKLFKDDEYCYVVTGLTEDMVMFDVEGSYSFYLAYSYDDFDKFFGHLERIKDKIKNNRLAKKMFPNAEESEDGEWLYV